MLFVILTQIETKSDLLTLVQWKISLIKRIAEAKVKGAMLSF